MELRPYQLDCCKAVGAGWKEFGKQLAVLPTGSGKTIIAAKVSMDIVEAGGRVLFLAHREELLTQAIDKFRSAIGIHPDLEKAQFRASQQSPIVVASIQTMVARKDHWPRDHFDLVVVDEAHHVLANTYRKVLSRFDGHARVLGITASPDRTDKRNLGAFFENIAFEVSLFELIRQGFLSPIACKAIPVQIDLSSVRRVAGDYSEADLGDAVEPYLREIARAIREHAPARKTLVFLPLIRTSVMFREICRAEGLSAEHVDGGLSCRREVLRRFADREFDVLCNAMLLTEGYDDPAIDCVVVLRPSQSRPLFAQMIGRGTRIAPGKTNLLLLDFLWLHEKHSLIRPAHLVASSEEIAEEMIGALEAGGGEERDLEDLSLEVCAQREEKLRAELAANSRRKGRTIDAVEFCLSLHDISLAEYAPTMGWHGKPPSEGQIRVLDKAGFDPDSIRDRGHASAIIDVLMTRRRLGLATPRQLRYLRQLGHPSPETATFQEANEFLNSHWGARPATSGVAA